MFQKYFEIINETLQIVLKNVIYILLLKTLHKISFLLKYHGRSQIKLLSSPINNMPRLIQMQKKKKHMEIICEKL